MNLDDLERFKKLDTQNMIGEIDALPDQLAGAWTLGQSFALPVVDVSGISRVVIAGLGGSAIGGDLLASFVADTSKVPVIVQRDYGLPAFAEGPQTLVVASSHSGNTEETLDAFDAALRASCNVVGVST
ncbi:MAG TPA: bifunctional phosphoglucose/phosphomannose isomerase, partial [Anaerolineales bacterium]